MISADDLDASANHLDDRFRGVHTGEHDPVEAPGQTESMVRSLPRYDEHAVIVDHIDKRNDNGIPGTPQCTIGTGEKSAEMNWRQELSDLCAGHGRHQFRAVRDALGKRLAERPRRYDRDNGRRGGWNLRFVFAGRLDPAHSRPVRLDVSRVEAGAGVNFLYKFGRNSAKTRRFVAGLGKRDASGLAACRNDRIRQSIHFADDFEVAEFVRNRKGRDRRGQAEPPGVSAGKAIKRRFLAAGPNQTDDPAPGA